LAFSGMVVSVIDNAEAEGKLGTRRCRCGRQAAHQPRLIASIRPRLRTSTPCEEEQRADRAPRM